MNEKTAKTAYQYVLGAAIVAGFFIVVYVVLQRAVPLDNEKLTLLLLGALVAKFGDVVNYFFGSSKGSADKTEIMANGKKE